MAKAAFRHPAVRGFSMTELAIVVGIMGMILGAIWAAAGMVYASHYAKQAREETLTIVNNWHGIFGGHPVDIAGNGTDITQLTLNNGFVPTNMIPSGGAGACVLGGASGNCYINGPWTGTQVHVQSFLANNAIALSYTNLTQTVCERLAATLTNASGLIQTTISGTVTQYPPLGTATPLSASQIDTQCNAAGNGNSILAMFSMN